MSDPVSAVVAAAVDVGTMGDKVAAFAIAQNLLWSYATVKGEFRPLLEAKRWWFVGSALAVGAIYATVEASLWCHAKGLVCAAGCGTNERGVQSATDLLFFMRGLGAFASSALASLVFWGTTRPADSQ